MKQNEEKGPFMEDGEGVCDIHEWGGGVGGGTKV